MRLCLCLLGLTSGLCAEPDRILFTRSGPSQSTLFVSKADGSEERPLLKSTSLDYNPAWSPNGRWIVFTSERDGAANLYRVKPDGTGLQRLTNNPALDDQAAFSPDGGKIVFVSSRAPGGTADLWILDLRTRKAKPLTSGPGGDFRPSWSPDGQWIAFSSDRGSTLTLRDRKGEFVPEQLVDLYVIHPDGTGLKRITEHGNFCGSPKWSHESRRVVAYCMSGAETNPYRARAPLVQDGETRLVWIDIGSGEVDNVPVGPGVKMNPAILPSGEIAYVRKDARAPGIFYGNGKPGPAGPVRSASWSPDGTRVVYHKFLAYELNRHAWEKTWSRNPQYELILTFDLSAFHPSGDRFLGLSSESANNNNLVIVETGSKLAKPILHLDGFAAVAQWMPGGDQIILGKGSFFPFAGLRERGAQVYLIQPDGSGLRQLTSGANHNSFPSPSPDGKRFVYRTFGPEGQGLRIMNIEDKSVATLTTEYDNFPVWSARGDLIVFVRKYNGDFEIFSIRPDGKDLRRLTNSPGADSHVGMSPDGEWIMFSSTRMGFKDESPYTDNTQPDAELFVMRYDGTKVQQLTDNQWEDALPTWQPSRRQRSGR